MSNMMKWFVVGIAAASALFVGLVLYGAMSGVHASMCASLPYDLKVLEACEQAKHCVYSHAVLHDLIDRIADCAR